MASRSGARGRAYTAQEDVLLCQSWISITQDPVIGNDQSGAQFWERIFSTFKVLLGTPTNRTVSSLTSRFQLISKEVAVFIAKLSNATTMVDIGTTETDKIREARVEYMATSGKAFKFNECYEILKDQPKFSLRTTQVFERVQNTQFGEGSGSQNSLTINNWDSDILVDTDSPTPLPDHQVAKLLKGKEKEWPKHQNTKIWPKKQPFFTAVYKESQDRRNAIKNRECDIKEWAEEDCIMGIVLNTLPINQRYYFMCRQNEILQK